MDMATPGLAIGAVVGRVGDLAIVEHLGGQTSFFLGYELKPGYDVSPQHDRPRISASERWTLSVGRITTPGSTT